MRAHLLADVKHGLDGALEFNLVSWGEARVQLAENARDHAEHLIDISPVIDDKSLEGGG